MNFDLFYKGDYVCVKNPYAANVAYKDTEGIVIDTDQNSIYVMFKNRAVISFKEEELSRIPKTKHTFKKSFVDKAIDIISGKGFDIK